MPDKTTTLNLNKPLGSEVVDIDVLNENMDILDTTVKDVQDFMTQTEADLASAEARITALDNAATGIAAEERKRVTAESGRVTAEDTRIANETGRVSAEQARVTAENQRAVAETARAAAEANRVSAETAREQVINDFVDTTDANKKDAEAYAVGTRGGTDVPDTDPTYHNNAKYYAGQASADAEAANAAKTTAVSTVETAIGNIRTEGTTQVSAVQTKGAEVLASIPDDYETLSTDVSALKSQLEDRVPKYGAAGFNNANPDLTRMYDAVGKTAQVGTDGDNSAVVNDFDNIAPFNRRKCVGHWEAGTDRAVFVVEAYEGDPDYAEDGTMGDYVAVDCTPAYVWESADRDIRAVSPMKLNGFRPFACLASKDDPTVCREHTYFPVYALAFDENGHAVSLPGYSNRQGDYASLLRAAKQYANTEVQQYCHLMPDDVAFYEETLYDIEFATHHCQSIMEGCVNLRHSNDDRVEMIDATHWLIHNYQAARVAGEFISIQPTSVDYNTANYYASHKIVSITRCDASGNADASGAYQLIETEDLGLGRTYEAGTEYRIVARPYNTGACAGVSTPSGSPVSNSDGLHPMKYRHRENVFGNQNQTTMDLFDLRVGEEGAYELEWYKMKDLDAGIVKNYGAADMAGDNFVKLGYVTPYENYKNGYITEEVCDDRYPDNRIPVVGSGGSAAKFVCDYASLSLSNVIRSVRRFGHWYHGATAGFGTRHAYNAPSTSSATSGGGLFMTQ